MWDNEYGIYLSRSSSNTVGWNRMTGNDYGFKLYLYSSGNTICGNTISENDYGIFQDYYACDSSLFHNNIIDNTIQVVSSRHSINTWDNSEGQGNYWSDYLGEDLDGGGIGDTNLPHNDVDEYPLMDPWDLIDEIRDIIKELEKIIEDNPDTPLADKMEDTQDKLNKAVEELEKSPPDNQAALGNMEGAVGDIQAAVDDGLLDPGEGNSLMDRLAAVARQMAVEAIEEAIEQDGDPDEIAEAQQLLTEADVLRDSGQYKDAIAKYKDALAKAEGAVF
jgi:tetratricopeptide (TPR) repeat protein